MAVNTIDKLQFLSFIINNNNNTSSNNNKHICIAPYGRNFRGAEL